MSHVHRRSAGAFALAAALVLAAPLSAQPAPTGDAGLWSTTTSFTRLAPTASAALLLTVDESAETLAPLPMPAMTRSQSTAMMIVGGAGLIVGSLIDGDTGTIIMVGGGVVGLVGLFQYLR